jgi:hypothetical protein
MLFNSLPFLFVFLPVTYWVFWRLEGKRQRYVWLTLTGYVFYSFWNYKFCALLLFSTTVSFLAGLGLLRWRTPGIRRLLLVVPITVDLLILGFFKYVDFALDSLSTALSWVSISLPVTPFNILLPIGISFYTFHNISYMVDAYRGTITPTRSFWEYACYVSLFSQLVAGPIVRFREIEQDLDRIDQHDRLQFLDKGWSFFAIGMVQKVLIADTIASVINPGLDQYSKLSTLDTWLCMLGYAYQLYFDLSGTEHRGLLAAMAYVPVFLPAGLRVHPAGGEPGVSMAGQPEPDADHVSGRTVARRQLDVRLLGTVPRRPAGDVSNHRQTVGSFACPAPAGGDVCAGRDRLGSVPGRERRDGRHAVGQNVSARRRGDADRRRAALLSSADCRRGCTPGSQHVRNEA